MTVETWTLLPSVPKVATRDAVRAEADGWTGVMLADSQNLAAELIVEMSMIVARTERVLVSPGVTNPVTRHPAVLAGAFATLQAESGGRIAVEIGRGDSALAHLGFSPMKLRPFRRYLQALQGYLRGDEVPFDPSFVPAHVASVGDLGLGVAPEGSSLRWLRPQQPKVPVGVAATGPKVIAIGATIGDAVSFSVGGDPERVRAAIERARAARIESGFDPDSLRLGAFLNIAVHDDMETAARITSGKLASFSRFSVMHGKVTGEATGADEAELERLHGKYDMTSHGRADAEHTTLLSAEFAERNAIIGSAKQCLERLMELRELGITRFFLTEEFSREGVAGESHAAIVEEIVPEVNSWT
ncbi:TIGR03842 family LLM class F420-dependent oxidoreductase [Rhodococcus olei]|uniref:TIGR03842 family LLM class F420-dependent oxidoreductase n=1 Tax=Rhodococcus olei TaxID=2161675 RepID=A0ABP8NYK4_9NOCA